MPRKNMNLPYSMRLYYTNFWQPTVQVQQNIFEKTLIEVYSSYTYACFLAFFASKILNYSRHSEISNFRKISTLKTSSFENSDLAFSNTHCASNAWLTVWTQKVVKEAYTSEQPTSVRTFQKILCFKWIVGCQKFVQNIRME